MLYRYTYEQSDKQRQKRLYQLQKQKYLGVGNENTTDQEWLANVRRDTYNSLQGHSAMLEYLTLANDSITSKRDMKIALLRKMAAQENTLKRQQPDNS